MDANGYDVKVQEIRAASSYFGNFLKTKDLRQTILNDSTKKGLGAAELLSHLRKAHFLNG